MEDLTPVDTSSVSLGPDADRATCLVDTTMLYAPASGGVRRYLSAKSGWIHDRRPTIRHAIMVPGRGDQAGERGMSYVKSLPLPGSGGYRLPLNPQTWAARLATEQPSLIEAADPYIPGFAARSAGRRLGIPVVGFCHSNLAAIAAAHLGSWAAIPARPIVRRLCEGFDALLAPSRFAAERLAEAGVGDVRAVPLGVDVDLFSPQAGAREAVRRMLNIAPEQRLLVFAGRAAAEKRIQVLVDTVERLGPRYRLLLIGCGPRDSGAGQVIGLPFEPDARKLAALLAGCDAFLHANPDETLGLIVLEALACGLPVVGVQAGGVGEIVTPEVGELAPTSTAVALAKAVERLFERDQGEMRTAARDHVARTYSWDAAFERLMGIYADLTGAAAFRSGDLRPVEARP